MSKVAIILVNYNGKEYIKECIESIQAIDYKNYKIIVVDNNSTDDSLVYLKSLGNEIKLIEAKENGGFSFGNNLGIKYAIENGFEYFLLLNNDTLVKRDFLSKMLESFNRNPDAGIVGAKIMYYPEKNRIWFGGGDVSWTRFRVVHNHIKETDNGQCNAEVEINFMTGCAMLISKEVIEKVGLLDEEYFMYCEDLDYSFKVLDNNFKIIFNPEAIVYHKVSLSSGGEDSAFSLYWKTKNTLKVMKKFKHRTSLFNYLLGNFIFYLEHVVKAIKYKINGNVENYNAIKKALSNI